MEKWILVTGTSKGIGSAVVHELEKRKIHVIAISRRDIQATSEFIHGVKFDWKDFSGLAGQIRTVLGDAKLNGVVNNAGVLIKESIEEAELENLQEQIKVNTWYPLELFRTLYRAELMASDCHVLNIGSMGGFQGASKFPGLYSYSISKAALVTLTECLDAEYGDSGLSFNCLALGAVNTEMLQEAFPGYISQVEPENMSKFIVSFLLDSGRIMSGKVIPVTKSDP